MKKKQNLEQTTNQTHSCLSKSLYLDWLWLGLFLSSPLLNMPGLLVLFGIVRGIVC